jgi:hypothetical protein
VIDTDYLRSIANGYYDLIRNLTPKESTQLLNDCLDEIDSLRAALEPFADITIPDDVKDETTVLSALKAGEIRKAKEVLG